MDKVGHTHIMSSHEQKIYLMTMKRQTTKESDDCHRLYDKYIKTMLRKEDQLWTIKQEDKNECYFFIKKKKEPETHE